jgi:HCOMODA/2-hydroxy-3-carboxy-muconic semialdehyde decarboxylase
MSEGHESPAAAIRELVAANHILASEGVVDALGHVSSRHPENPERYLLSCSRSPALVGEEDIVEFDLDNKPIDQRGRPMYVERAIHGAVYRARPDVGAVCHSHAHPLIPFSVAGVPLRPVFVLGATVGEEVPVWDIREDFPDGGGMLVVNDTIGSALARKLGARRACLLAGHGALVADETVLRVVQVAISLVTNAALLLQSLALAATQRDRELRFLSSAEIDAMAEIALSAGPLQRMWEYWAHRAGHEPSET